MHPWSTSRKVAALVFAGAAYVALACLAMYMAGVLFLVLCWANPAQAGITSIFSYWTLYEDDPGLRARLKLASGVPALGLLVILPGAMLVAARPSRALFGDARFAKAAEVRRAGLYGGGGPAILVGRHRWKDVALPGQLSVMLSAPTRSGKGVGVVIPNLLTWPDSVVVLDIKGENFKVTAGYRATLAPVFLFAPCDQRGGTHCWNPLAVVRTDEIYRVADLLSIGQALFPNDPRGGAEAFFNDQARNLFLGLGLLLLESPDLPRTIGEMLRQASGVGRSITAHLNDTIRRRQVAGTPLSCECTDALRRLLSNSENTLSCIVATFNAPLIIFADTAVDAATSGDDFRLDDLRRRRMSVYVHVPPNRLADAQPLLNLFFSQLVSLNSKVLPEHDPTLKYQCLVINDEFTAMGRVNMIATSAPYLAGYNLRLLTVVQALSQLDSVYGEKEARTFATNHGLQILFAPREQRDAEEYSAMLGYLTQTSTSRGRSHSYSSHAHSSTSRTDSDQRRALLLPQEFKELGSESAVLIVENCKPVLARKIRYYDDRKLKRKLLPPPPVPWVNLERHRLLVHHLRMTAAGAEAGPRLSGVADDLSRLAGLQPDALPDAQADPLARRFSEFVSREQTLPTERQRDPKRR